MANEKFAAFARAASLKTCMRVMAACGIAVAAMTSQAATVQLDPAYGNGGRASMGAGPADEMLRDTVIQPDGKMVLTGDCDYSGLCLIRLNTDGTPDLSFNGTGRVVDKSAGTFYTAALAVQPDGKLLVAGLCGPTQSDHFCVARRNADGSTDLGFNGTGLAKTLVVSGGGTILGLALQSDGKLVVTGRCGSRFCAIRYNPNGSVDVSFANAGKLVDPDDSAMAHRPIKIAMQSDDKLVELAYCPALSSNCLRRYLVDGQPDSSFGNGGLVAFSSGIGVNSKVFLKVQADGRIALAATHCPGNGASDFCIARFLSNGTLESGVVTGSTYAIPLGIALQPEGKILISGVCSLSQDVPAICVTRHGIDGMPDISFGSGGTTNTDMVRDSGDVSISALPDGSIVLGGTCNPARSNNYSRNGDFCAVRLMPSGAFDTTFQSTGKTLLKVARVGGIPEAAVLQPDGKVVMTGRCPAEVKSNFAPPNDDDTCLVRFAADGKADLTFNVVGSVQIDFAAAETGKWLALQADGKIVVVTNCGLFSSEDRNGKVCIARLNADGSLDTTFNGQGHLAIAMVNSSFPAYSAMSGVAIQADGKIVIAGVCSETSAAQCLARFNADGSLDASFGVSGKLYTAPEAGTTLPFPASQGQVLAIMNDGRILVASQCVFGSGSADFCVTRYLPNGNLDTGFNSTGWVRTHVTSGADRPTALRILADGGILLAGNCSGIACVVRYQPNGALDTTLNQTGKLLASTGSIGALAPLPGGKFLTVDRKLTRWNADGSIDTTFDDDFIESALSAVFVETLPGGAIVVAGYHYPNDFGPDSFAALRYLPMTDTPATLNFAVQTGVPLLSVRVSNAITVSGFSGAAPISVRGGEYSIGCTATFSSDPGTVNSGDVVCVRHQSGVSPYFSTVTHLTVGTQTGAFVSVTGEFIALTIVKSGNGRVISEPAGIDCGADCTETLQAGTVTLTALPDAGHGLVSWNMGQSGVVCNEFPEAPTCTFALDAPLSIAVVFAPKVALSIAKAGTGGGVVKSIPSGIDCGSDCAATFAEGTLVGLQAIANPGSLFSGWTGSYENCLTSATCQVSMYGAKAVTARFDKMVVLTIQKTGNGGGTVDSVPSGISCGTDCSQTYASEAQVTLSAVAAPGSMFIGWSGGGCTGLGNCVVTLSADTTVSAEFALPPTQPARSDFNGDGRSDILWHNSTSGWLYELQMNGLAVGASALIDKETDLNWRVRAVADLNGDGRADIVWQNDATGGVFGLLMIGMNTLAEGTIYTEPNTNWKIVGAGDFNGDGKADLLWKNAATGDVFLLLMNGLAVVSGGVIYSEPNQNWVIQKVADFNGDGKADIVWRNTATGDVFLMLMDGTTVAGGGVIYSEPNTNWQIQAAADFNGDGKADILWRNVATGDVFMMLMNGTTIIGGSVFYGEPNADWKIVATGDYNGDGKADILWRNTTTGQVYMMLMNGATISSGDFVYTEPDQAWKILGP